MSSIFLFVYFLSTHIRIFLFLSLFSLSYPLWCLVSCQEPEGPDQQEGNGEAQNSAAAHAQAAIDVAVAPENSSEAAVKEQAKVVEVAGSKAKTGKDASVAEQEADEEEAKSTAIAVATPHPASPPTPQAPVARGASSAAVSTQSPAVASACTTAATSPDALCLEGKHLPTGWQVVEETCDDTTAVKNTKVVACNANASAQQVRILSVHES